MEVNLLCSRRNF